MVLVALARLDGSGDHWRSFYDMEFLLMGLQTESNEPLCWRGALGAGGTVETLAILEDHW
jgi:hypothetical protein